MEQTQPHSQTQLSPPHQQQTPPLLLQSQQQQQFNAKFKNSNNLLLTNINNNNRLDSSLMTQSKANNNYSTLSSSKTDLNITNKRQSVSDEVITNNKSNNNNSTATNTNNKKSILKRNSSLINFKSLDISLKSIYSNFRNNNKSSSKTLDYNASSTGLNYKSIDSTKNNRTPYFKVDTVDRDNEETALLTYHQSPGGYRGSIDRQSKMNLNYMSTATDLTRSQSSSPFLAISPSSIRRSSTSDIIGKKIQATNTGESRRPSTTDMLRKARERKGSEKGLGRSMSHGGLGCRGGKRGGRRRSMAF